MGILDIISKKKREFRQAQKVGISSEDWEKYKAAKRKQLFKKEQQYKREREERKLKEKYSKPSVGNRLKTGIINQAKNQKKKTLLKRSNVNLGLVRDPLEMNKNNPWLK